MWHRHVIGTVDDDTGDVIGLDAVAVGEVIASSISLHTQSRVLIVGLSVTVRISLSLSVCSKAINNVSTFFVLVSRNLDLSHASEQLQN